jgi:hypothetical protein
VHVSFPLVVKTVPPHHAHARNEAVRTMTSHTHARYEVVRAVAPTRYKVVKTVASQASGGHVSPPPQQLPPNVPVFAQAVYEQSI